jgi:hypothetical protein
MFIRSMVLAGVIALAGCSQPNQQASVGALESALTAADILALQYTTQPTCPRSAPLCADPAIKLRIKAAAQTAYDSVKAAETEASAGKTVDMTASTAAIAALQDMLASVYANTPAKGM